MASTVLPVGPTGSITRRSAQVDRPTYEIGLARGLWIAGRVAAGLSTFIGLFVLAGYALRWRWAVELHPSLPPMYPNAAVGFAIGGVSALLATSSERRRRLTALVGFSVIGLGALTTLVLHAIGAGPTVLEALWPSDSFVAATTPVPGRPVVESSFAFACVALAGVLVTVRRRPALSQALAFGTLCVGAAGVLGFVLGVDRRAIGTFVIGMALHTAMGLGALGAAVTLSRPTLGLFAGLVRTGPSAQLSRRLLGVMVATPLVASAVSTTVLRTLSDESLGESLIAVGQIVILGGLVILPLRAAERIELAATKTLVEARALVEEVGEQDVIVDSLVSTLIQRPSPPPGWTLGFRQTAALGMLPGDTCQVIERADGAVLVALIDVAGHGTTAALQALRLRTEIAALWHAGHSVESITDELDRSVIEMGTISTGLLLSWDPTLEVWRYVNAGHPPLLVMQRGRVDRWARTRPLLGVTAPAATADIHCIDTSATLVFYSDGISEARSVDRQLLADESLTNAVRRSGAAGAQLVADACMDQALGHASDRLRDDAVVLVLQRT